MAWRIKSGDNYSDPNFESDHEYNAYYLKIVGQVPSGLNLIRIPKIRIPISELIGEAIPIAVVAYMESYSVAKTIASSNGQLHILNASQELWANGFANILGSICSGYPVSGSFSRSALNYSCGARTPLSKVTTMLVVVISLLSLTSTFNYIPQAALSAVIMAAIYNLISFSDLWNAWKNNKKDFITILVTWIITLTFNTEIGLAVGVGISIATLLIDQASAKTNAPEVLRKAVDNQGVAVVRLRQDLNFLTAGRLHDMMLPLFLPKPLTSDAHTRTIDRIFTRISLFLDSVLLIHKPKYAEYQPKAVLIDMSFVNTVDLTGMNDLAELQKDMRRYGVKSMVINSMRCIEEQLIKFGIENDGGPELESVLAYGGNIPIRAAKGNQHHPVATIPNAETYRSLEDNYPANESAETKHYEDSPAAIDHVEMVVVSKPLADSRDISLRNMSYDCSSL
jgi:MFS superfamily sulfate permease-like transporter